MRIVVVIQQAMLPASATTTALLSNGVCKWLQLPAVTGVLQGMHVLEDDVSKLDWRVPSEVLVLRKVECIAYFHWTYFFCYDKRTDRLTVCCMENN